MTDTTKYNAHKRLQRMIIYQKKGQSIENERSLETYNLLSLNHE